MLLLGLDALWLSARYEKRKAWVAFDREGQVAADSAAEPSSNSDEPSDESLKLLIVKLTIAAAVIFAAGFLLSLSGDALADQTGLGTSFVGFLLVGVSTSLPELSTIIAALKLKRHAMAVGDILGSNVFNLLLIFLTDVLFIGDPVLNFAGRFEIAASLLGIVMMGILLLGLLERRDRTVFKMGYDSAALIVVFFGGVIILYALSGQTA